MIERHFKLRVTVRGRDTDAVHMGISRFQIALRPLIGALENVSIQANLEADGPARQIPEDAAAK